MPRLIYLNSAWPKRRNHFPCGGMHGTWSALTEPSFKSGRLGSRPLLLATLPEINLALRNDPKHWRDRAAQMRALAETTKSETAVTIILKLADDFDRVADQEEEELLRGPGGG
jgi:hypothetical protein